MPIIEGQLDAAGKRFGLIVSRTNEVISARLLEGALDCLRRHGAREEQFEIVWVPGAFEAPQAAARLAASGRVDVMITLATLIRGETPHFDYLAAEITRGTSRVAMESGLPGTFGVVTADSLEQAMERAGGKQGNKGWQAALAAIELSSVFDGVDLAGRPRGGGRRGKKA